MNEILSIFHIDAQMLIAQLINFAVLMVLIVTVVVRPLRKVLFEREKTIREGLDNALHAKTKLFQAAQDAQEIKLSAEKEAHEILSKTHAKALEAAGKMEQQIIKEHEHMRAVFESELASRRESDLQRFKEESVEIIIASVRQVIKGAFDNEQFSADYIASISKK